MNSDVVVVVFFVCLFFLFSESPLLVIAEAMFSKEAAFLLVHKLPVSTNVFIMSCRQSSVSMTFLC